jgi:hypothetical protein
VLILCRNGQLLLTKDNQKDHKDAQTIEYQINQAQSGSKED